MLGFLRCLGEAIVNKGFKALIGQIPFVGVLYEVGEEAYDRWYKRGERASLREELEKVAAVSREQLPVEVAEVVEQVAAGQPQSVKEMLSAYLTQVPAAIQRSCRRPEDPTGKTLPPSLNLTAAKDLIPLLPNRLPRFKPGDQPLPGVSWQLTELLGVGGFGEVWKASHSRLKGLPPVALKFCLDPSAAATLRREAAPLDQVMMQGIDKGIVPLRNAYLDKEPVCLEYDYIEGGDLMTLVRRMQNLPVEKRAERAAQTIRILAEVIGRMHRLSPPVIHRDLKPANVLTRRKADGSWQLLVTDFGIGAVAAEKEVQAERMGTTTRGDLLATMALGTCTPLYASPQQKAGERADPRDDVHALGVMWYQLLLGDPMRGIGADYAEDLQELGLEEATIRLLGSCVANNAARRPANAAELAGRISNVNRLPVQSSPASPVSSTTSARPKTSSDGQSEPTSGEDFISRAKARLAKGLHRESLRDLEAALQLDPAITAPNRSDWGIIRATAHEAIGNPQPKAALEYHNQAYHAQTLSLIEHMVACFEESIRLDPGFLWSANDLAWLVATWPVVSLRNGELAIKYATLATEATGGRCWAFLDSLAAAYAAAGRFKEAVRTVERALGLAPTDNQEEIRFQLNRYRAGKGWLDRSRVEGEGAMRTLEWPPSKSPADPDVKSMPPVVACPSCKTKIELPVNAAGRQFRCPECGQIFTAPVPVHSRGRKHS